MSKVRFRGATQLPQTTAPTAAESTTVEAQPPSLSRWNLDVQEVQKPDVGRWTARHLKMGIEAEEISSTSNTANSLLFLSTGPLAYVSMMPVLVEIQENMEVLHPGMQPHDLGVQNYQTSLTKLCLLLELFPHVYSNTGGDKWAEIRDEVKQGVDTLSAFRSLFKTKGAQLAVWDQETQSWSEGLRPEQVQYEKPRHLEKRRRKVLEWKEGFHRHFEEIQQTLSRPTEEPTWHRRRKVMSSDTWGGVSQKPRAGRTGLHNLKRLIEGLVDEGREAFKEARLLTHICSPRDEQDVAQVGRRLTTLRDLLQTFPELMPDPEMRNRFLKRLSRASERYLFVDELVKARRQAGSPEAKYMLTERIDEAWLEQKNWQEDTKLFQTLKSITEYLFKPSQTALSLMME